MIRARWLIRTAALLASLMLGLAALSASAAEPFRIDWYAVASGDLLTTSPTPGYAMVVGDYTKAQGAILGKAMERLEKGEKGQILVLVTLQ